MKVDRFSTKKNSDPYSIIKFKTTTSEIRNPDGTIVFSQSNVEVPDGWSQVAADVLAQKYFRKAGIAKFLKKVGITSQREIENYIRKKISEDNFIEDSSIKLSIRLTIDDDKLSHSIEETIKIK